MKTILRQAPAIFPDLLRESDIVTLHVPLNRQTRAMISHRELEAMKPTAYLINFPEAADLGSRLTQGFANHGVLLRGSNVINIMPPLCVTSEEIDQIVSVIDLVIAEISPQLGVG